MGVLDHSPVGLPSSHASRRLATAVRVVGAAEDGRLTVMLPGGGEIDIAAQPGRYEVGATAVVDTDSSGRVVRAVAAASDIPDGAPVVDVLPSARLDAVARERAEEAAALAEQAGVDLAEARAALEAADEILGAAPVGLSRLIADGAASPEVEEALYAQLVTTRLLLASKVITGELLADGAVSARALNVTTEDTLDPATGRAVSILPDGVRLFVQDAEGGLRPVTGMTTAGEQYYYVLDHAGDVLAGISSDGDLTAQNAALRSVTVDGRALGDVVRDEQAMQVVANGWNSLANTKTTTGEMFLFNVTFPAKSGKYYLFLISSPRGLYGNQADRVVGLRVRVSGVGSLPNQSSTVVAEATTQAGVQYSAVSGSGIYFRGSAGEIVNASLSLFIDSGTPGTVTMVQGTTPRLTVFEMGGGLGNIGVWRGDDYPAGGATPAPPPTVERQTVWSPEQVAQSFEVYRSTGAPATGTTAATNPLAGQSPYWTGDNHPRTHVFFNLSTLRSQMSGSDTVDSRVWFKVAHTYANAGGTLVLLGHNHSTLPGSWGGTVRELWRGTVRAGQAYDLRLGAQLGAEIRDGVIQGLSLVPADTSANSYLYLTWDAGALRPKIQVQYTK